jgi:transposase
MCTREATGVVKTTHFHVHEHEELSERDATALLDLEGLAVVGVDVGVDGTRTIHVVSVEEGSAACPACGTISTSLRGWSLTHPRDVPFGDHALVLTWHKRRYRCREKHCPRASFTEALPCVPARSRLTSRLRSAVGRGVGEGFASVAAVCGFYRVSWPVAHAAYVVLVDPVLAAPLPSVTVLGIDDTRRGKPVWAQDLTSKRWHVVADRWHTGFVDAAGSGGLLAQVDGRNAACVREWLERQPASWRAGISHVCIDLSASYAAAVRAALPDAVLVADRFHLVKAANDMVTDVRQRVIRENEGRRGRTSDPAWRSRRKLLTGHERLEPVAFARMWNQLIDTGDPGIEILHAYTVKENLRSLLALAGTKPSPSEISARLVAFYEQAASCPAPEARRLATTVETWWPAVLAGIETGYSNARSEGYNRVGKHTARNAFGFRNIDNHHRRVRWDSTRQHRRMSSAKPRVPAQV